MNKLNKTFEQGQVLTSDELNGITGKVDEIVELLSSLDNDEHSGSTGMTALQIQQKIDDAKKQLLDIIDKQLKELWDSIKKIDEFPEGITKVENDFDWALFIKKTEDGIAYLTELKQAYNEISLGSYAKKLKEIDDWYESTGSQIKLTPTEISMILGAFDPEGNVKVEAASIYAAITENEDMHTLSSLLSLNADLVIIGGDVTLTGGMTLGNGLEALGGRILDLTSSAITTENLTVSMRGKIDNLESNVATIHGDIEAITATVNDITVKNKADIVNAVIKDLDVTENLKGKTISGVTIDIGNGNFTVDSNGNVVANSITLNGQGHTMIRQPNEVITLPDPRPGTIVTIINAVPSSPNTSTEAKIITKDRSTLHIRYFNATGGYWSRAMSYEDTKLPAAVVEAIVYIQLVANGVDWYVTACTVSDGTAWPGNRNLS